MKETKIRLTKYFDTFPLGQESWLLFNTLWGGIHIISSSQKKVLEGFDESQVESLDTTYKKWLDLFQKHHYICTAYDEASKFEELKSDYENYLSNRELEIFICPTYFCASGCWYCDIKDTVSPAQPEPIKASFIDSAFNSIEGIKKAQSKEVKTLILYGGEPFQEFTRHPIEKIFGLAVKKDYKIRSFTNGLYIKGFIDLLKDFTGVIRDILTTIDGTEEYHNQIRGGRNYFNIVVDGIDCLLENNIPIIIQTNFSRKNINSLPSLANFFKAKGYLMNQNLKWAGRTIKDRHCRDSFSEELLSEDEAVIQTIHLRRKEPLLQRMGDKRIFYTLRYIATVLNFIKRDSDFKGLNFHGCAPESINSMVFGADGYLYPCTESTGKDEFRFGKYHPFLELYDDKISMWQSSLSYNIPKCRECKWILVCGGRCNLTSFAKNQSFSEPQCPKVRDILENFINEFKNEILKFDFLRL